MSESLTDSPSAEHGLHYDTPATTWDEALPLGNGITGALVWGNGNPLRISLDRADLWDLRPIPEFESQEYSYAELRRWIADGNAQAINKLYDAPYFRPAPTKIPAGRIEMRWQQAPQFESASLDIRDAVAQLRFANDIDLQVVVHATDAVGMISLIDSRTQHQDTFPDIQLVAPLFSGEARTEGFDGGDYGDLAALNYGPAEQFHGGDYRAFVQEGFDGFRFAVYLGWREQDGGWQAAWSVASSFEDADPLKLARQRVETALATGFESLLSTHRAWWSEYWSKSALTLPNKRLEKLWYLEQYKFGAASRKGTPPITLQGPWTADDGKLPPWKGDYHNDLNTQLSYWPCYSANHLEEGMSFLDWLWEIRPNSEAWTRSFFDLPGLNVVGVTDLAGKAMGGWPQYVFSCTTACWLAQHFYWHWRYSRDREFLQSRAYPYLHEAATFIEAITEERNSEGRRTLPLSSSPEINDNSLEAWFPGITNYDLSLMQWLLQASAELADEMNQPDAAARWRRVLTELPDLAIGEDGRLLVAPDYPLQESHRHHSQAMAIYPLKLLDWHAGEEDQRTILATLANMDELGTDYWCGYSFSWLAAMLAQAMNGEKAEEALEIFSKAFTLRNSFHCNGDQSGEGYSTFTYRPFTLEGNFAAAAAVQEMLLQSHGGIIRIFPAVPNSWQDISFHTLRAEGAFLVSAQRTNGVVESVEITAEQGGLCRLVSPFSNELLELELQPNQHITLTDNS